MPKPRNSSVNKQSILPPIFEGLSDDDRLRSHQNTSIVFASLKTVPECAAEAQPRHRGRLRQDSLPRPSLARTLPDYRCGASPCANNDLAQSCEGMERYIEHSIGANYPKGGVSADLIAYLLSLISYFLSLAPRNPPFVLC